VPEKYLDYSMSLNSFFMLNKLTKDQKALYISTGQKGLQFSTAIP